MNLERARPVATAGEPVRGMSPAAGGVADCVTPIRSQARQGDAAVDTEAA